MNKITKISVYQKNNQTYITFSRSNQFGVRAFPVMKDDKRVHSLVRLESMIESGYLKVSFFHIMPSGEFVLSTVPAKCEDKLPVVDESDNSWLLEAVAHNDVMRQAYELGYERAKSEVVNKIDELLGDDRDDPEPILFSNKVEDFIQVGWDITRFDMEEQKDIIELSNLYMLGGMDYDEAINHAVWHWNHDIKYHPNRPAPVKIIRCPECEGEALLTWLPTFGKWLCADCNIEFVA